MCKIIPPAHIESNYTLHCFISPSFTSSMQSGLNLCAVSSVLPFAFRCLMLQERHLARITFHSHDTETIQMSQYGLEAFLKLILDNKWHSRNDSGSFPIFVPAKSYRARPSEICCCWRAFVDLIHPLCAFLVIFQQLNISYIHQKRPLKPKLNPQTPSNKLGCTGNK